VPAARRQKALEVPRVSARRRGLVAVIVGAVFAAAVGTAHALIPPTGDFTISPSVGAVGDEVTFTATGLTNGDLLGTIDEVRWEVDSNGPVVVDDAGTEFTGTFTYQTPGTKQVTMTIIDSEGEEATVVKSFRVNAAPTAAITPLASIPNPGEQVTLRGSGSTDDAGITDYDWDIDDDGQFDDASGAVVQWTPRTAGDKRIRLRVRDAQNLTDVAVTTVHVNFAPRAAITFSPQSPLTNQRVDLTSISDDPDGPILSESWDLDGDGQYDDAVGKVATRSFAAGGLHTVRVRVVDAQQRADTESAVIAVSAPPIVVPPEPIRPKPVIRVVGVSNSRRTRIDLLTVRTLRGAIVSVRCKGRSCPKPKATSTRSTGRLVRVRRLERKLRNGTKIAILVTMPNKIGRQTMLTLRKKKEPRRQTLCWWPGEKRPRSCAG
jgi:PKD repeat protein